jgi:hypothetical protein
MDNKYENVCRSTTYREELKQKSELGNVNLARHVEEIIWFLSNYRIYVHKLVILIFQVAEENYDSASLYFSVQITRFNEVLEKNKTAITTSTYQSSETCKKILSLR